MASFTRSSTTTRRGKRWSTTSTWRSQASGRDWARGSWRRPLEAVIERSAKSGLYVWVLEQNVPAQAFYQARGGRCVERAPAVAPGGVAGRLVGAPRKLRYVWPEAEALRR